MSDDQSSDPTFLHDWMVLLKFGQREHLEALRREGLLYMNPQAFFSTLEADAVRADRFEGTDRIYQPAAIGQLTVEGPIDSTGTLTKIVITPADMAGPLLVSLSTTRRYNIYCMFGIRRPLAAPFVDERNFEFGDSFVLFLNTQAFLDRACAAAKEAGFSCDAHHVEYYHAGEHSGETGPFRKPSTFAYQSEFRLAVSPGLIEPLGLRVGNLTDITTPVLPLAEINRLVDFSEENARTAGLSR